MQRRRILISMITAAALGVSLAACSSSGGGATDAMKAKGPITIWYSNNAQEVQWGKSMVSSWNSAHPKEQIKAQEVPAGKSTEEVITAAITAGTTPCLVFNNLPAATGQFQKQGGLVDLSKFSDGKSYIESRSGSAAAQYKSPNGDYYQMPWKSNPVMIFFNKAIFEKAGLGDNPDLSTYDKFLAAAKKVVSSGAAKYAIYPSPTSEFFQPNFDFLPLYAAETGGKGMIENGKSTLTSPEATTVANFWKSIYSQGLAGKEQYQGDAFADGKSAMAIVGPWAIAYYGDKVKWGSVPVPTKDGVSADKTYTFPDAKNIGMYTSCKNQGTAWDVLKFATSKDQDGKLLDVTGQMPIRDQLQSTYASYFDSHPAYKEFGAQAARTVDDPSGPNTVAQMQALRDAYTKSVISGSGSVEDAFKAASDKIDQLQTQK
ncbi:sugar ABC transporter substrate-binding protein [Diaminobutyricibacter tongyongensis]|uniref:Sugar ABC transporter substrate-binding protein n=1 Tax=Leifsonia tongyongensis TaxID=1268043 RepID=A0A6L9Y1T9_9MICO|nr:sugar ABC transporter substrate-binding protein [Diaminobutyricibacter tongyongensis]NEN07367.1 sugar ABC transporter substrate-binding protein [Diaminobutyricibacter tongyongensis]